MDSLSAGSSDRQENAGSFQRAHDGSSRDNHVYSDDCRFDSNWSRCAPLTVYLTNRGNNDRIASQISYEKQIARAGLIREKGKELYELASEWQRNLSTQCIAIQAVMRGELTYNQALDMQNEGVTRGKHYRIHLLAQAYFPDITRKLGEVEGKVEAVSKLRMYHKAAYQAGEASAAAAFLRPFTDANLALSNAMDELKGEIARRVGLL